MESITIGSGITQIDNPNGEGSSFTNCAYLRTITCLATTAPAIGWQTFRYVGKSVGGKTLNVPANSSGYDTGYWKSQLIDNGYTLNATL